MSNEEKNSTHYHLMGVLGSGMLPLAMLAKHKGLTISGCNSGPSKDELIPIRVDDVHSPNHLRNIDYLVLSSAIPLDNFEVLAAKKANIPIIHRSDLLATLLHKAKKSITISGTHGKTTTSALIAFLLKEMGHDPDAIIGGALMNFDKTYLASKVDNYFVAESDESDGTFIKYKPFAAVITNINVDHLDFYKNEEGIFTHFIKHVQNIDKNGFTVLNADDTNSVKVSKYATNPVFFGLEQKCAFYADNIEQEQGHTIFTLHAKSRKFRIKTLLLGKHNVLNILAALAAISSFGLSLDLALPALSKFKGVKRRLSVYRLDENITLIDDYAHNPDKIEAAISTVAKAYASYRLIVVFEPHRYSRVKTQYESFIRAFSKAKEAYVLPVYAAGENPISEISNDKLAFDIRENSCTMTIAVNNFDQVIQEIEKTKTKNTVILTIGAGEIYRFVTQYKGYLACSKQKTKPAKNL